MESSSRNASAGGGGKSPINIRTFKSEDAPAVKRICFAHFRSLVAPAVVYFCQKHAQDLFVILGCCKLFVTWRQFFIMMSIFMAYLLARSRWEMECYIQQHCPDLKDITRSYLTDPSGHFWVAESVDGPTPEIVGCIGILSYRGDHRVAQLMRLVVSENARRMRVGSRLLAQLEEFARNMSFRELRLYTNNLNTNHIKFVALHGFETIQVVRRGLMRGDLIQWRKLLTDDQEEVAAATKRRMTALFMD